MHTVASLRASSKCFRAACAAERLLRVISNGQLVQYWPNHPSNNDILITCRIFSFDLHHPVPDLLHESKTRSLSGNTSHQYKIMSLTGWSKTIAKYVAYAQTTPHNGEEKNIRILGHKKPPYNRQLCKLHSLCLLLFPVSLHHPTFLQPKFFFMTEAEAGSSCT